MMASQQKGLPESRQDGWCGGGNFSGWLASMFAEWMAFLSARQRNGMLARNQPSKQAGKQNSVKSA